MDIQRHLRLFPVPMDGNVLIKWMFKMDTQNIRSHLLKNTLSKWTLTLSLLIGHSFYTYVVDIQNGRSTREATVCLPVQPGLPFPLTAGGSGSCSLRYLGYFPSPFMPGGCGTVKKDAASPRKCGVRRRFAAPSDQRMALNFARKSRVKKPFWMRSPNEPFAPTLCRV